ncbi:MAG: exodeoxyribonuclease VII large subunit [Rhodoferax sp.]|nr:exodeoxyribonuclease VII large subunit [Rhodoferax sp.]
MPDVTPTSTAPPLTRTPPRVWSVGALCHAIADALDARFNPVRVAGEISGFVRAASGHCYFSLKDESGQIRCAMFKRAAIGLDFAPRDGQRVEVSGRLGVYEPRGELQLVVESMARAGEGTLFEQFLLLKAKLESQGLFDPAHKRPLPRRVRGIGLVTSLGAAALHDVVTALQRRVPHIPVVLAPASVQGVGAAAEISRALQQLYALALPGPDAPGTDAVPIDVILLVRGGGALEDLWSFNDETLARTLFDSPVPVVAGIGHETDFTIADFVADLRAPTPTAAAELCAPARQEALDAAAQLQDRLQTAAYRLLDRRAQALDLATSRLGRPSAGLAGRQLALAASAQRMAHALPQRLQARAVALQRTQAALSVAAQRSLQAQTHRLASLELRLGLLDPRLVLARGYAWLTNAQGQALTQAGQMHPGQVVTATLADGTAALEVQSVVTN